MILLALPVGDAMAAAELRLLNAVPGGPPAQLRLSAAPQVELEGVSFGDATEYRAAPSGRARLTLLAGEKRVAESSSNLKDGARYTVVAATKPGSKRLDLHLYRDGRAIAGEARLRVVSAAPEVTRAEIKLDGRGLGSLDARQATDYTARDPGTYRLAAVKPGGGELAAAPGLSLVAGTAASAYLIGSAGERTRFVLLQDAAAAPRTGPATGLGGAAGGGANWLLVLLAAAAAGTTGGLLYSRASRRG